MLVPAAAADGGGTADKPVHGAGLPVAGASAPLSQNALWRCTAPRGALHALCKDALCRTVYTSRALQTCTVPHSVHCAAQLASALTHLQPAGCAMSTPGPEIDSTVALACGRRPRSWAEWDAAAVARAKRGRRSRRRQRSTKSSRSLPPRSTTSPCQGCKNIPRAVAGARGGGRSSHPVRVFRAVLAWPHARTVRHPPDAKTISGIELVFT